MKIRLIIILIVALIGNQGFSQSLEEYNRIAANNNPVLLAKYKNFEIALEKIPQVSSLPDPTISFGVFISPVETRVGPQRAKVSLQQMFPWFGTLEARGDAATLNAEAKYQAFIEAKNQLYYRIAEAYYPLYELRRLIAIEEENIEILESFKTIANSNFANGKGKLVDVLRVDIMLQDSETNLKILREKEYSLKVNFNKLLNQSENEQVFIPDSIPLQSPEENYRKDSLIDKNPVLKELDLKIAESEEYEQVAYRQGLPTMGIGLDYAFIGDRTDPAGEISPPPDNGKNAIMPMVSFTLPIFREKYKAAVNEAKLKKESFAQQKEEYSNRLIAGYETVLYQVQRQTDLIELYTYQIEETDEILNLLFTDYGNSGNEFEEVLRMEQQLLKYKKLKVNAETKYLIALAKLDYITSKTF